MKRLILIVFSLLLGFSSCQKENIEQPTDTTPSTPTTPDDPNGLRDAFLGTWKVTTTAEMEAGILGTITRDEESTYTITEGNQPNDVSITLTSEYGSTTATGTVDEAGLHMNSYDQTSSFMSFSFTMTVAPAVIPFPSENTINWTTSISGKVGFYNATGTLHCVGVRQ